MRKFSLGYMKTCFYPDRRFRSWFIGLFMWLCIMSPLHLSFNCTHSLPHARFCLGSCRTSLTHVIERRFVCVIAWRAHASLPGWPHSVRPTTDFYHVLASKLFPLIIIDFWIDNKRCVFDLIEMLSVNCEICVIGWCATIKNSFNVLRVHVHASF